MKRFFSLLLSLALAVNIAGCTVNNDQPQDKELFVIGFSQVGSESDWRLANTQSMLDTFTEEKGYELRMDNARQRQDNQFAAVRSYILEDVDFIIIAPTVEDGWEPVLNEVREAGIPVIIMDRSVSVDDKDLYLTNIGSDFLTEGNMAVEWLENETSGMAEDDTLRILHLQGTYGATAQLLRTKALEVAVAQHEDWEFAAQLYGDFTEAKAYEVVTDYLRTDKDIDVIYSENDNMTFGAMRALDDAGITYGKNGQVKIISFDATKKALQYCLEGKIDLCVECNPLHGPDVEKLIAMYRDGEDIPKHVYVEETIFTQRDLTQDFIDSREY